MNLKKRGPHDQFGIKPSDPLPIDSSSEDPDPDLSQPQTVFDKEQPPTFLAA